jgi:hypothetical protein
MMNVNAVLEGGPTGLPEPERIRHVPPGEFKVKVSFLNGYEHFIATGEHVPLMQGAVRIFRWEMRTKIAE